MTEALDTLRYFVKEREAIRLRKEVRRDAGPDSTLLRPQYTADTILDKFRFCNVRRKDDRVSRWLVTNVLTQEHIDYDLRSFLLFSALCRWVNWPPSIKAIMDEGLYPKKRLDFKKIGKLLDHLAKKEKVWTGAYMIRAPKKRGGKKGKFIAEEVIGKHLKGILPTLETLLTATSPGPTYRAVWEALRKAENFGGFMSGQVAGDLTYTSLLQNAPDLKTWAPMGPGSVRGFNRLMGITPIKKRPSEELWLEKLAEWRSIIVAELGPEYENLTALDCQNICCEYDKYLRVKNGEGRPRANYIPHVY